MDVELIRNSFWDYIMGSPVRARTVVRNSSNLFLFHVPAIISSKVTPSWTCGARLDRLGSRSKPIISLFFFGGTIYELFIQILMRDQSCNHMSTNGRGTILCLGPLNSRSVMVSKIGRQNESRESREMHN